MSADRNDVPSKDLVDLMLWVDGKRDRYHGPSAAWDEGDRLGLIAEYGKSLTAKGKTVLRGLEESP